MFKNPFRCRHPWMWLDVDKKESSGGIDDKGRCETRVMHMYCRKCQKHLTKKYAVLTAKGRKDWEDLEATEDTAYTIQSYTPKDGWT